MCCQQEKSWYWLSSFWELLRLAFGTCFALLCCSSKHKLQLGIFSSYQQRKACSKRISLMRFCVDLWFQLRKHVESYEKIKFYVCPKKHKKLIQIAWKAFKFLKKPKIHKNVLEKRLKAFKAKIFPLKPFLVSAKYKKSFKLFLQNIKIYFQKNFFRKKH